MKVIAACFLSIFVLEALLSLSFAKEFVIAVIENDKDGRVSKLIVDTIDNRKIKAFYKDYYDVGKSRVRVLLGTELKAKRPIIVEKRNERIIVQLESENFDEERGGIINIDTLFNAITKERKKYELELSKKIDGNWSLFKNKEPISRIYIKMNRVAIIGEVGISELLMN